MNNNDIDQTRILPFRSLIVAREGILEFLFKEIKKINLNGLVEKFPPHVYLDFNGGISMTPIYDGKQSLKILEYMNDNLKLSKKSKGDTRIDLEESGILGYRSFGVIDFYDAILNPEVFNVQIGIDSRHNKNTIIRINRSPYRSWQYVLFQMNCQY